jgi:hypothetical protein
MATEDVMRHMPRIEIDDPNRAMLRRDRVEPICA